MSTHSNALELAEAQAWFKASYSEDNGGNCLEVADLIPTRNLVAIRDSKNPTGPALALSPKAFTEFVASIKA
ncbi:DUF397 domain-containing protein [Streptomyces sp. NPDC002643]